MRHAREHLLNRSVICVINELVDVNSSVERRFEPRVNLYERRPPGICSRCVFKLQYPSYEQPNPSEPQGPDRCSYEMGHRVGSRPCRPEYHQQDKAYLRLARFFETTPLLP